MRCSVAISAKRGRVGGTVIDLRIALGYGVEFLGNQGGRQRPSQRRCSDADR